VVRAGPSRSLKGARACVIREESWFESRSRTATSQGVIDGADAMTVESMSSEAAMVRECSDHGLHEEHCVSAY
jgi:hypothetical protein